MKLDKYKLTYDESAYDNGVYCGLIYKFRLKIKALDRTKKGAPQRFVVRTIDVISKYGAVEHFNKNKASIAYTLNIRNADKMVLEDFDVLAITNKNPYKKYDF